MSAIEIVGLAGSGKSTLARTLAERRAAVAVADFLHTRQAQHWPYVAHSAPRVVPLVARDAGGPRLSWDEIKFVIYVSEWSRYLRARHAGGTALLDQGPVFALARLLWAGKPVTRTARFTAWIGDMVALWSRELRTIVRLRCPDDVLLERINGRAQAHEARGLPRDQALAVLDAHRRAYDDLVARFEAAHTEVLEFDTSRLGPDELAAAVDDAVREAA